MMQDLTNMPQQMDTALKHLETALGITPATGFRNICSPICEDYAISDIHPLAYEEIKGALKLAKVSFKEVGKDGLKMMPPVNTGKLRNFCDIITFSAEYCKNTYVTECAKAATSLASTMHKNGISPEAQRHAIATLVMSLDSDVMPAKERATFVKQLLPEARLVTNGVYKGIA